jgi:hypothetical protein
MPNATITPPAVIKVQVGTPRSPQATAINYSTPNTLKGATDLNLSGVVDGDVIAYQANTSSFVVAPPGGITNIDGGLF